MKENHFKEVEGDEEDYEQGIRDYHEDCVYGYRCEFNKSYRLGVNVAKESEND